MTTRLHASGRIALILSGVVLLTGAAQPVTCSEQFNNDIAAVEARAAEAYAEIKKDVAYLKANEPVYIARAKASMQLICALDSFASAGASSLQANLQNPSPTVAKGINATLTQAAAVNNGCLSFQATQANIATGVPLIDLSASIYNAYLGYKAAAASVTSAVSKGV